MTTQPSHHTTPIGRVLVKYGISLRDLSKCLADGNVKHNSPATLSRLCRGNVSEDIANELRPAAAKCLSRFLVEKGLAKSEVDHELQQAFNSEEYQPMITKRNTLTDAECEYFGFRDHEGKPVDPFTRPPESRDEVFVSPQLLEVYDKCIDAIKYRHFIAVLGPIGAGKTTLRAMIEDHVAGEENLVVAWPEFFDQGRVTPLEIARSLLRECGAEHAPGRPATAATAVKNRLRAMTQNGKRVALAFDECHKMNETAVRSLKNFFEMSSGGFQKYLGIVLLGWPTFEFTLQMPDFQEIYERVEVIHMPSFSSTARDYIAHRLKFAGVTDITKIFDDEALEFICSQAETPLALGNIANEALRISKRDFDNRQVIGDAIKTRMFFDTPVKQGFKKR